MGFQPPHAGRKVYRDLSGCRGAAPAFAGAHGGHGRAVCSSAAGRYFDMTERDLLEAFAVLIGLVLEKDHIIEAFKHAEILEASEHLRRSLLESVSHELKTPLSAVQAGIDALARPIESDERRQGTLREVQLAVRRLHRVINNLLNMTRIESGMIQPKLDWCDVGELIQAAIELVGENIGEHQIVLELDESYQWSR